MPETAKVCKKKKRPRSLQTVRLSWSAKSCTLFGLLPVCVHPAPRGGTEKGLSPLAVEFKRPPFCFVCLPKRCWRTRPFPLPCVPVWGGVLGQGSFALTPVSLIPNQCSDVPPFNFCVHSDWLKFTNPHHVLLSALQAVRSAQAGGPQSPQGRVHQALKAFGKRGGRARKILRKYFVYFFSGSRKVPFHAAKKP